MSDEHDMVDDYDMFEAPDRARVDDYAYGSSGENVAEYEYESSGEDEIVAEYGDDSTDDGDSGDEHEYEPALSPMLGPPAPLIDGDAPVADPDDSGEPPVAPRRVAWERPTRIAVASLALIAILFLFVFPTRSYLAQQRQVGDARRAVEILKVQNEKLAREAKRLKTPSEVERLARVQFNMVFQGEQAYNVISPASSSSATTTTTLP